jgi:hypothetical protein
MLRPARREGRSPPILTTSGGGARDLDAKVKRLLQEAS